MRESELKAHLRGLLGEAGLVALCGAFGGTRLYIPVRLAGNNAIVAALGEAPAQLLCRELGPAEIRVPLARRERALAMHRAGASNPAIARALGVTESAVFKLLRREPDLPARPRGSIIGHQMQLL